MRDSRSSLSTILAIGLVAGSAGVAAAQEGSPEAIAPTWVTGNITLASSCTGPDIAFDGDIRHNWNYVCSPQTWTASDPRFTGEVAAMWNDDVYKTDNGYNAVNVSARYLHNDEGGWTCTSSNLFEGSGLFPTGLTGETANCVGQGGYEGLSAILILDDAAGYPFSGLIFPGDFPPLPEAPAAE